MQVDFYQLSRDPVEKLLPSIAQRILDNGGRLLVVSADEERLDRISQGLWNAGSATFLPHGRPKSPNPDLQPILLSSTCTPANGARHVALSDGLWRDEALEFDRAFFFFDQDSIDAARQRWRSLTKCEGVEPRFWRQEGRKWIQGP
ncbi:DNA polymerase III subunit chi [Rhizorhapis suberifaciens]|uniref:DNA polymerase-3 subunit chi n=1 Tax=Rhizorhapis suberifaciens TaxID=13656 RepID=A0A840HWC7_9SPHN|nr:DNA polymerase III subunit chi [Rhizorhapis suberifaciens]MBB4641880.1 DNA polymerase-3 subunit chi [Rhizorhapis suberifaciens]